MYSCLKVSRSFDCEMAVPIKLTFKYGAKTMLETCSKHSIWVFKCVFFFSVRFIRSISLLANTVLYIQQ